LAVIRPPNEEKLDSFLRICEIWNNDCVPFSQPHSPRKETKEDYKPNTLQRDTHKLEDSSECWHFYETWEIW